MQSIAFLVALSAEVLVRVLLIESLGRLCFNRQPARLVRSQEHAAYLLAQAGTNIYKELLEEMHAYSSV